MALPLLIALTWALVWLLSLGVAQVRVVDAARETARGLARGDQTAAAVAAGRQVAPAGTRIIVADADDQIRVTATAEVDGPGGLFAFVPAATVTATAVTVREPGP